jgi:GTPase Era involved in 16S rRNA processing
LQIILYDTTGVIKKEMHKLDSMMMKNVRSAIGSADCVIVVVDACMLGTELSLSSRGRMTLGVGEIF